jgi:hypothetical protein
MADVAAGFVGAGGAGRGGIVDHHGAIGGGVGQGDAVQFGGAETGLVHDQVPFNVDSFEDTTQCRSLYSTLETYHTLFYLSMHESFMKV